MIGTPQVGQKYLLVVMSEGGLKGGVGDARTSSKVSRWRCPGPAFRLGSSEMMACRAMGFLDVDELTV